MGRRIGSVPATEFKAKCLELMDRVAERRERLSRPARRAIGAAERSDGVAISSISLWELALLIDKGRIQVEGTPERFLTRLAERPSLAVLEITPQIAALTAQFPPGFP